MKELQKKLNFLTEKYAIEKDLELKDDSTVLINGEEFPIFPQALFH